MAHWDDEKMVGVMPPKDILCATCKYKMQPVVVKGKTINRYAYAVCDKYSTKPMDVLYGKKPCEVYEHER